MPAGWAMAAAAVVAAVVSSDSSRKASNTQADAARRVASSQADMFNITNDQQAPWRDAGQTALGQLSAGTADGGQFQHQFNADDLKTNLAPNYQFMLDQGLGASKNAGNLQTGLLSGNSIKAVNDYAQNYAGNAYQNAFNNYNVNQSNIFNRLASIAQIGQTSVGQTAQSSLGFGSNIGSAQLAGAAASAAGQVGQAKALSGGISSLGAIYGANQRTPSTSSGGGDAFYNGNYWNGGDYSSNGEFVSSTGGT